MDKSSIQSLLRVFFQYESRAVLLLSDSGIQGILFKDEIEAVMSDLAALNDADALPFHSITNVEYLLDLFQEYSVHENGSRVLPAVDALYKPAGSYSRSEIINAWEGAPVKTEPAVSYMRSSVTKPSFIRRQLKSEVPGEIIQPSNEKTGTGQVSAKSAIKAPVIIQRQGQKPQGSNLSLLALEALPLPMLAVDVKGKTLFYNHDWETFREKFPILETQDLMNKTKDKMAQMAFEGALTVHSTLEFSDFLPRATVKMRSLLETGAQRPVVTGYLFWIDRGIAPPSPEPISLASSTPNQERRAPDELPAKATTPEIIAAKQSPDEEYEGKTLNDILAEEERKALSWAIQKAQGNQSNAAALLGIPRQTFAYRYKKYFT